ADAIHHHVDTGEARRPILGRHVLVEVAGDPFDGRIDAARKFNIAARADDGQAPAPQRFDDGAADEAVGPGDETLHQRRRPRLASCPALSRVSRSNTVRPRVLDRRVNPRVKSEDRSGDDVSPDHALERDLVVELLVEGGPAVPAAAAAAERSRAAELAAAARTVLAPSAAARVEHGESRVEALQHHFGRIAILPRLVLPFAGLERALEINLGALLEILL